MVRGLPIAVASLVAVHGLSYSLQDMGSSQTRDGMNWFPCTDRWILNHWTTREVPMSIFLTRKTFLFSPKESYGLSVP